MPKRDKDAPARQQFKQQALDLDAPARSYAVSELNGEIKWLLESNYGSVWVEGELSGLSRPGSGHMYFTLKDDRAQIRCAMFRGDNRRLNFRPQDGQAVLCRGRLSIYEARGDYQLIADRMIETGAGALQRRFEENKKKLYLEGLFDADHKQQIPERPASIGIISSATGAALRDVLNVLQRRYPLARVIIYPTLVQGESAPASICRMIKIANRRAETDLLLLVRGGGSIEDLWAFNEEPVARAIFASQLPVVSGVGHEIDTTIADYVADLRAPTPSAAAELVSPDGEQLLQTLRRTDGVLTRLIRQLLLRATAQIQQFQQRLQRRHPARHLQQLAQRNDELSIRLQRSIGQRLEHAGIRRRHLHQSLQQLSPARQLARRQQHLDSCRDRLAAAISRRMTDAQFRVSVSQRALNAISPLNTLQRGYAIVESKNGDIITENNQTSRGEDIQIRLKRGQLSAKVVDTSD